MKYIIAAMIPAGLLTGLYFFFMARRIFRAFGKDPKAPPLNYLCILIFILTGITACFFRTVPALFLYYLMVLDFLLQAADFLLLRLLPEDKKERWQSSAFRKWAAVSGIVPLFLTVCILLGGAHRMNHIVPTRYEVETDKSIRPEGYRIVLIADSHYGVAGNRDLLLRKCREIEAQNPDMVILAGDIVDENTSPEEAVEVLEAFGGISSVYGTFFVWGNHDRSSESLHTRFSEEFLRNALSENHITLLEDAVYPVEDDLLLIGRDDFYEEKKGKKRKAMTELLDGAEKNRYLVCIDHQPCAFEEESEAGCDLILCGHTHGGQIWPSSIVENILKLNDGVYGRYQIGNTTAIITSGFYGWSYPIRTDAPSEYVIVDLRIREPLP